VGLESASPDTTSSPATASVNSQDSDDSDDDDDDDDETEEDESSESSESGESSTLAPTTVTQEPFAETTDEPIVPTIVTDTETARGDSLGGYPSDYKSMNFVEEKSYHKVPAPYKSYEYIGTGKKMAYDMTEGNEVDKSLKVYKALQIHNDILEEDTSTPEVEIQGLDISSQDQDLSPRQASLPEEEKEESISTSESTSAPEEEEQEEEKQSDSDSTTSASTSQESEDEDSQSSEEATATPGAADSESDESPETDSDEEVVGPDATTDIPVFITAK
uniref:Secreted phosphoprotein 1 n=2 Tax=Cyclopterus lumpus TaxID=8103 RepID=A0A8C2X0K3_CYCLU